MNNQKNESENSEIVNIFWFRRDLRLNDNAGLYHCLESGLPVIPVFIFDTEILNQLNDRNDRRVEFIHDSLMDMQSKLALSGRSMLILHGSPESVWRKLIKKFRIKSVYMNHDYEPYAISRDGNIKTLLKENGIDSHTFKDQVIFEKKEIVRENGHPYSIYTPYRKKWENRLSIKDLTEYPSDQLIDHFRVMRADKIPDLSQLGFVKSGFTYPEKIIIDEIIADYESKRDFPGINGTSRLSVHLRFGTISIRYLVKRALELNETWLGELIWREFFMMILWHFPKVINAPFRDKYTNIPWRDDPEGFERWRAGKTGYPIVDAGMRELNQTGFMHNRVRMITAGFLTKHLLIDWRKGERYFAEKLLDFDLAANNGNWQWAAGCGCDAAPYFRIFNPIIQAKKFDAGLKYIRKWIPEFETADYPKPIIEHPYARNRALDVYKSALME
ncbi:MAG: deoxyribodipyrimidine photo-lyase [Calditrichaceae bacterium]